MATSRLKKVDEFLTCTICSDIYTDPCTLHCQHTFCRKCITRYTKTRPEALQSKTIPCPCCRQVTKVPDSTKPVDEWAKQLKPSIIIQGLIDTSQPGLTTNVTDRCCHVCDQLGETTPAVSWCKECDMPLCDRCTKAHRVNLASRNHEVCSLSKEVNIRRRRKVMCGEHKENCIEFHCKDCGKSACQTCCIIHHRACKSVVTIESVKKEITSDLNSKKEKISKILEMRSLNVSRKQTAIEGASKKKLTIQFQIRSVSQKATDIIKQKEKLLMDELDEVTEKQMTQMQADLKTEEIDIQMYRQHCEFIDQAVNSESVMDMYDVYQACESGTLVIKDVNDTNDKQQIDDIQFTQYADKIQRVLDDLQFGEIKVSNQNLCNPTSDLSLCCTSGEVKAAAFPKLPPGYFGTHPKFKEYGLSAVTHNDPVIHLDSNTVTIDIRSENAMRVSANLISCENERDYKEYVFSQTKGSIATFMVNLPNPGFYKLQLYAIPASDMSRKMPGIYTYLINCKKMTKAVFPFPKQYAKWKEDCYMTEPCIIPTTKTSNGQQISLSQLTPTVNFRVNIPRAESVVIIINGETWILLDRLQGDEWTGTLEVAPYYGRDTKIKLSAKYDKDSTSYTCLLEYVI